MNYKIEFWGGDLNGAVRYYKTLQTAKQQAKRYITRCSKKYGLSNDAYAEIYIKGILLESYE